MSALPPKADVTAVGRESPKLTLSGRFVCALSQLCGHGKIKKTTTKLTCIKDPGHGLSLFESGVLSVRDYRVRTEDEGMVMRQWIKPGIFGAVVGAVVGAIALAIVGFTSLGWVTSNEAESMALKYADAAVVKAFVPVCVARAQMDSETGTLLQELAGMTSKRERRSFIVIAGWAKMSSHETFNKNLVDACARALGELPAA